MVDQQLNESHVLVNTSEYEGFSNTFVEAWMRKVIVLSMNSNPENIITDQKIGFICSSLSELIDKTDLLIKDAQLRTKMAQKSYEYGIKNHSLEHNIVSFAKLLS